MNHPKLSDYKTLETISVLALASLIIGLVFKLHIFYVISLLLLLIGLFLKRVSALIANGWMKFAHILGTINTRILLFLIFYLFLTPIALLYRIFKGDFMMLRRDEEKRKSYWMKRDHQYKPKDLENVW
jgi:hypothetical protein